MCFFNNRMKRRAEKMRLTWLNDEFICKDLYSPFKIDKDSDYRKDLKNKYDIVMNQAKKSGADDESMIIIFHSFLICIPPSTMKDCPWKMPCVL